MKRDRHGKAKILSHEEIQLLFTHGLKTTRDRTIFATALFTAARINEVVTLLSADIYDVKGQVRSPTAGGYAITPHDPQGQYQG
ncbi:hypothetical protein [Nostoc sp. MG11]|uniref:hypothetical protein n=1 Tax=Nostoc sp. MG11 TaxID=2721166 RepID=UPI0029FECCD1|nr:hypothetical protein [Nostoc sp. MG11]